MSRQTQRVICNKQFELILDNDFRQYLQRDQCCSILDLHNFRKYIINRFKNVRKIKIFESFHNYVGSRDLMIVEINKLFSYFIKYFSRIEFISYYPSLIYKNHLDEFISRCENEIRSLEIIHCFGVADMSHLSKLKNLKSIVINAPFNLELLKLQNNGQFFFQNLENASLAFTRNDLDLVENFFQQNSTLESLTIQSFISTEFGKHRKILNKLYHLKNLKKLTLTLSVAPDDDLVFYVLKQLPAKCNKLISLTLIVNPKAHSSHIQVFDRIVYVLASWSNLKHLNLSFMAYIKNDYIKCHHFQSLSALKSFSINVPFTLNERFLINIDSVFPNLTYLNIQCINFKQISYNSISLCNKLEEIFIETPDKLWLNLYKTRLKQLFVIIPKLRLFKYNNNYI